MAGRPGLAGAPFSGRAALLSPLDRLVYDRKRMVELFEFDYQLEMYKPAAKRRWGYWAMPILYGDRLVGKLDATADPKAGVLRVDAIHQDVPFSAAMAKAVDREIDRPRELGRGGPGPSRPSRPSGLAEARLDLTHPGRRPTSPARGRVRPAARTGSGPRPALARAAEPVRHAGVELGDLAGAEHEVVVAEDQAHPAGQDVQPLVPLVRLGSAARLRRPG